MAWVWMRVCACARALLARDWLAYAHFFHAWCVHDPASALYKKATWGAILVLLQLLLLQLLLLLLLLLLLCWLRQSYHHQHTPSCTRANSRKTHFRQLSSPECIKEDPLFLVKPSKHVRQLQTHGMLALPMHSLSLRGYGFGPRDGVHTQGPWCTPG